MLQNVIKFEIACSTVHLDVRLVEERCKEGDKHKKWQVEKGLHPSHVFH